MTDLLHDPGMLSARAQQFLRGCGQQLLLGLCCCCKLPSPFHAPQAADAP
jgi:hypothetical protein